MIRLKNWTLRAPVVIDFPGDEIFLYTNKVHKRKGFKGYEVLLLKARNQMFNVLYPSILLVS